MVTDGVLYRLEKPGDTRNNTRQVGPLGWHTMGEGSEGCMRLRSADLSQLRDLLYPPCHFLLDKRIDKLCAANGPTKVMPSLSGDAHIQVTKDALGFAQEGMLNHQPGLAAVGLPSVRFQHPLVHQWRMPDHFKWLDVARNGLVFRRSTAFPTAQRRENWSREQSGTEEQSNTGLFIQLIKANPTNWGGGRRLATASSAEKKKNFFVFPVLRLRVQ